MTLSHDKQLFARAYLAHSFNATRAAMVTYNIGRSEAASKGSRLLQDPEVAAAITQLVSERSQQLKIDASWVLLQAVEIFERCMVTEKVLDKNGLETGEYIFDPSNALKALALIGKHVDVQAFEARQDNTERKELIQRLIRGRMRSAQLEHDSPVSFMD